MKKLVCIALFAVLIAGCSDDVQSPEETTPPLLFTPSSLARGTEGEVYHDTVSVSRNVSPLREITVAYGHMPPGLDLSHNQGESTAVISGTPTQPGLFSFTVRAWCYGEDESRQSNDKRYSIEILEPLPDLTVSPDSLAGGMLNYSYQQTVAVSQNLAPTLGIEVASGSLPPGLSIAHTTPGDTAIISGTPAAAGDYAFTVHAWSDVEDRGTQVGDKEYRIEIVPEEPHRFDYDLPDVLGDYEVGTRRSQTVTHVGSPARLDSMLVRVGAFGGGYLCEFAYDFSVLLLNWYVFKNDELIYDVEYCAHGIPHEQFVCERWLALQDPPQVEAGDTITFEIRASQMPVGCPGIRDADGTVLEARVSLLLDYSVE